MSALTPGRILTFYSYKGGTGRSMALANVAWILASNGKRVLAVDWDLEAPGLHRYFAPFLADPDLTATEGIIEFVRKFETEALSPAGDSGPEADATTWYRPLADLSRYAAALDWDFGPCGYLHFVPSGRQGPAYTRNVNSFNWDNFYQRLGGAAFLEAAKEHLRPKYDYVLIDSRTGVSDTAGVCTVQMPDDLVVFFTANNQSIEGCAALAAAVERIRRTIPGGSDLRIFPVLTRTERNERDKLDRRKRLARAVFKPFLERHIPSEHEQADYWGRVETPYDPYYSYEEVLATFRDEPSQELTLLSRMERLTAYLTENEVQRLAAPDPSRRAEALSRFFRVEQGSLERLREQPAWGSAAAAAAGQGAGPERRLVVTVRGFTRGASAGGPPWTHLLEDMVHEELGALDPQRRPEIAFRHIRVGVLDLLRFLGPFGTRWHSLRIERKLRDALDEYRDGRVDVVAHGLGTYFAAWAVAAICLRDARRRRPLFHTIILAGSVLPSGFRWDDLRARGAAERVINECGTLDNAVLRAAWLPASTGASGRFGFSGLTDSRYQNRFHRLDHDGFFEDAGGTASFMRDRWVPLLTSNEPAAPMDERTEQDRASEIEPPPSLTPVLRFAAFLLAALLPVFVVRDMGQRAEYRQRRLAESAWFGNFDNLALRSAPAVLTAESTEQFRRAINTIETGEASFPEGPTALITTARAYDRLGQMYRESAGRTTASSPSLRFLGQFAGSGGAGLDLALNAFENADPLWTTLAARYPNVEDYTLARASTLTSLGDVQAERGRLKEARDAYTEARRILGPLESRHPDRTEIGASLARIGSDLGFVEMRLIMIPEAIETFDQVLRTAGREPDGPDGRDPDRAWQRSIAAQVRLNLGTSHYWAGRMGRAAEELEQALAAGRGSPGASSDSPTAESLRAACLSSLGFVRLAEGDRDEARRRFTAAADILEKAGITRGPFVPATESPRLGLAWASLGAGDQAAIRAAAEQVSGLLGATRAALDPRAEADLARLHFLRAELARESAEPRSVKQATNPGIADAVRSDYDQAVEIWSRLPRMLTLDLPTRALALARLERSREALAAAAELDSQQLPAASCVSVAQVYEAALAATPTDSIGGKNAEHAVGWLTRAEKAGYFRHVANRGILQGGGMFSKLSGNPDFQKLRDRAAGAAQKK